jgi:predicted amidohydrolase
VAFILTLVITLEMLMKEQVKLGLVQMSMSADPAENRLKAARLIGVAAKKGAQIVCLPELFSTLYFPVVEHFEQDLREPLDGPTAQFLSQQARNHRIVIVGGSIFEAGTHADFNTSHVFGPDGELLGIYRKSHIPHDPSFFEKNYFVQSNEGFRVIDTPFARIGVLICFDQWFPEASRCLTLMGADVIFYPTAIGTVDTIGEIEGSWQDAWETVQRGQAVANNIPICAVNRVGKEGRSNFWGGSFLCNAFGQLVVKADDSEGVWVGELDKSHTRYVRESWLILPNRRPDLYGLCVKEKPQI